MVKVKHITPTSCFQHNIEQWNWLDARWHCEWGNWPLITLTSFRPYLLFLDCFTISFLFSWNSRVPSKGLCNKFSPYCASIYIISFFLFAVFIFFHIMYFHPIVHTTEKSSLILHMSLFSFVVVHSWMKIHFEKLDIEISKTITQKYSLDMCVRVCDAKILSWDDKKLCFNWKDFESIWLCKMETVLNLKAFDLFGCSIWSDLLLFLKLHSL